jgi:hypothetical protein
MRARSNGFGCEREKHKWLSPGHTFKLLESELDAAVAMLQHKASAVEVQLAEVGCPTRKSNCPLIRDIHPVI